MQHSACQPLPCHPHARPGTAVLKQRQRYRGLKAYKEKVAKVMQDGEVDSYASDPMSPQAYRYLCGKAMV